MSLREQGSFALQEITLVTLALPLNDIGVNSCGL